jgi:hypothetical protein
MAAAWQSREVADELGPHMDGCVMPLKALLGLGGCQATAALAPRLPSTTLAESGS